MKRKLRIASAIVWALSLWTPIRIILLGHVATEQQGLASACVGLIALFIGVSADLCHEGEK